MADFTPTWLTQINRHEHTDNDGIEIIRSFHCVPYMAYPAVQKVLQGYVTEAGGIFTRHPPAHDPYKPICYCTSTRVEFASPDAMASAQSLKFNPAAGKIKEPLEDQREELAQSAAGAIIHAHYRPLLTAWDLTKDDPKHHRFDWMEPRITTGMKTLAWPGGYKVTAKGLIGTQAVDVPDESATPVPVTISDVSIRRIFVGDPNFAATSTYHNVVNAETFPPKGHPAAGGIPQFEPRTLKYVGDSLEYQIDSEGNRWYTQTHNFQWVRTFADILVDEKGIEDKGFITWNHILCHPRVGSKIGWYAASKEGVDVFNIQWFGVQVDGGRLHNEGYFLALFGE